MPNRGLVHIVAGAPSSRDGVEDPVDPTLAEQALADWGETRESCRDFLESELARSSEGPRATAALIEKYWIRRLATDLRDSDNVRFMLQGPPTGPPGASQPGCAGPGALPSPSECVGGDDVLWSTTRFREVFDGAPPGVRSPLAVQWMSEPAWDEGSGEFDWEAFDALVEPTVKVGPDGSAEDELPWVDGRFETEVGPACGEDLDCDGGTCVDDRCLRVVEPELNLTPQDMHLMRSQLAFFALAGVARPEGRPCEGDGDCGSASYRCRDGRCHDPAAPCRVRDTILMLSYDDPPPTWGSHEECTTPPQLDAAQDKANVRWMRWGCGCDADGGCPYRSTCRSPCLDDPEDPACAGAEPVCVQDEYVKLYGPKRPFGVLGSLVDIASPPNPGTCEQAPFQRPRDLAGRPFLTRVHAILLQDSRPGSWIHLGHEEATAAAFVGDGVAVTPCGVPRDIRGGDPMQLSHMVSCDYETRYQALLASLRSHAANAICTPEDVDLPSSSTELLP